MTDYTKLVEALRCGEYKPECGASDCRYWSGLGCMDGQLMTDAADAIEALQAQLPKRGEWVYNDGDYIPYCSICCMPQDTETAYCHFCGAKMFASDTNVLNKNDTTDGPIITPCLGCSDYDGYGGCKSKGGCARAKMEVQE